MVFPSRDDRRGHQQHLDGRHCAVYQCGVYYAAVMNGGGTVNSSNAALTIQNAPVLSGANDLPAIMRTMSTTAGRW